MDRNTVLAIILIGVILLLMGPYYKWVGGDKEKSVIVKTDTIYTDTLKKSPIEEKTVLTVVEDIPEAETIEDEQILKHEE